MLPKLADDTAAAKAVGGDRCYLSSRAPRHQIAPPPPLVAPSFTRNKAVNLIDQHISFIATFMQQLERDLPSWMEKKGQPA